MVYIERGWKTAVRRRMVMKVYAKNFLLVGLLAVGVRESNAARGSELDAQAAHAIRVDAARAGDREAQFELGERYAEGDGVPRDGREAVLWWIQAARQAHPEAGARLAAAIENGTYMPRDLERAEAFWLRAAQWGSATAQWRMAERATRTADALYWIQQAAQQQHPAALYALARHLENGQHVERDEQKAWDLYRRAAEAGHPQAMNTFGVVLAEGLYAEPDFSTAYFWFHLADLNGIATARSNRDAIASRLTFRERRRHRRRAKAVYEGRADVP